MSVKVRFAPSPTGSLHLGGALTALINYLFARAREGTLLLRIDDTDAGRTVAGQEAAIMDDLRWLGLGWDEGPVRQSERAERHRDAAGLAQWVVLRDGAMYLSAPGVPAFVIVRADGRPTYHWASVVDDLDHGITHVIRGADHLPNRPLHEAAFRALGADPPEFIHHAIVLGEHGKLSKREAAASIADLRRAGYPAEAVVNQLGLAASSGPGEVLSLAELVARFDPDRIASGELRLEQARLDSLAAGHLSRLSEAEFAERVAPFAPAGTDPAQLRALAPALRGVHTLAEAGDLVASVVLPPRPHPLPELADVRAAFPDRLSEQQAHDLVDELRRRNIPLRQARLALTGRERGPELWAVLAAIPRDEAIRRAA
ncbi:MAG: glutamate--tRNA ligase [Gaiellales bacterium]